MKKQLISVGMAVAAAVSLLSTGAALAGPMLTVDGTSVTLTPSLVFPDTWNFQAATGDGWAVTGTVADNSPSAIGALDLSSFAATCTVTLGCSTSPLTMSLSDVGFTTVAGTLTSSLSNTQVVGSGSIEQSAYFDTNNQYFGGSPTSNSLLSSFTITCSTGGGFCGNSVTSTGPGAMTPYSLTLTDVFTDSSANAVEFSADGAITTPEPATLALFAAGLLGCALVVGHRRRSSQDRV